MPKKNVDKLDPQTASQFAEFIDTLANETLGEYWHRSSCEGRTRDADASAVGRLLDHIMEDGGGVNLRAELYKHLEKLIHNRLIDIQGGEYRETKDLGIHFVEIKKDK
jgi:hypothetical protein